MASAGADEAQDDQLLVSEYPPPPYYYRQVQSCNLKPPPIPLDKIKLAAERALTTTDENAINLANNDDLVGVFGEIVEDPRLVYQNFLEKDEVDDPKIIYNKIKELNESVLESYTELTQDLVYRPKQNKAKRDEVSENLMQMIAQSNQFRSHQAREILIEIFEEQVIMKKKRLDELRESVRYADEALKRVDADATMKDI